MSERKPQAGDRVRVTYEGTYEPTLRGGLLVIPGSPKRSIFEDAVIEVLELADDPSKALIGEVREHPDGWVRIKARDGEWVDLGDGTVDGYVTDDVVRGAKVLGAVPGTPAAERTVSAEQVGRWETDDLELGDDGTDGYARTVAESQVDPHKPVVLKKADTSPHGWEPRVWHSEGEEPPAGVTTLEWIDAPRGTHYRYLINRNGWAWARRRDGGTATRGRAWRLAIGTSPGRYREVRS